MIKKIIKDHKGVTLVELLIALAIIGFVLAAAYFFFSFAQNSFNQSERQSTVNGQVCTFLTNIGREVRQAQRPNSVAGVHSLMDAHDYAVNPVSTANTAIDIYSYQSSTIFRRTSYRLVGTTLQRGYVNASETTAPFFLTSALGNKVSNSPAMYIGTIPAAGSGQAGAWETVLDGVSVGSSGKAFTVEAVSPASDDGLYKLTIDMQVVGSPAAAKPIYINNIYMCRSKGTATTF